MTTPILLCTGCGELGEPKEDLRLYECGSCGYEFASEDSNRCEECNRFASVVSKTVCGDCESDMVQVGEVATCSSCDATIVKGKECPACTPRPYSSWLEFESARGKMNDKARWVAVDLLYMVENEIRVLPPHLENIPRRIRQVEQMAKRLAQGYLDGDSKVQLPESADDYLQRPDDELWPLPPLQRMRARLKRWQRLGT